MDAWERFVRTVRFEQVDHVPVALWFTGRAFANASDITIFDYIHNPEAMMEAEARAFRRFPDVTFVPGVMPDYGDTVMLPSALGAGGMVRPSVIQSGSYLNGRDICSRSSSSWRSRL